MTPKEFINIINMWKRNAHYGMVSLYDIAIVCAWNYDKVNEHLLADILSYYKLETEAEDVKEFVNQTLFK